MFCPSCGTEERQPNQYCRACGTELRIVRVALEKPDRVTISAVTAREEIGRAVADRIRETKSVKELSGLAENVLPEIEKFLESPAEKRLRRIRSGVITASVGIGATILLSLISLFEKDAPFIFAAGLIVFFIGLGLVLNGLYFTLPPQSIEDNSLEANRQRELEKSLGISNNQLNEYNPPAVNKTSSVSSVTEHTTRQLAEE
jgi:hypothetical protein